MFCDLDKIFCTRFRFIESVWSPGRRAGLHRSQWLEISVEGSLEISSKCKRFHISDKMCQSGLSRHTAIYSSSRTVFWDLTIAEQNWELKVDTQLAGLIWSSLSKLLITLELGGGNKATVSRHQNHNKYPLKPNLSRKGSKCTKDFIHERGRRVWDILTCSVWFEQTLLLLVQIRGLPSLAGDK